jgi:hypothetical protein
MTNQKKESYSLLATREDLQVLDEQDLEEVAGGGLADNPLAKKQFPQETQPLLPPLDRAVTKWRDERPGLPWQGTYKPPTIVTGVLKK